MKRILALLLACVILAGMGAPAFAADDDTGSHVFENANMSSPQTITINGTYKASDAEDPVYHVTVKWDSLAFTVDVENQLIWQPGSHTYLDRRTPDWTSNKSYSQASITVSNASNVPVNVNGTFDGTGAEALGITVNKSSTFGVDQQLARARVDEPDMDATVEYHLALQGKPDFSKMESDVPYDLGTVTIKVSAVGA